jgi:hypothetical protein
VDSSFHQAGVIELGVSIDPITHIHTGATVTLGSAAVTVQGFGGQILMDDASDLITGSGGQVLMNDQNTITGAGTIGIGGIGFTNVEAQSLVDATGFLKIRTDSYTIDNAGTLAATGGGDLFLEGTIVNSAEIDADFGSIVRLDGDVTGTGVLNISGGDMLAQGSVAAGQTVAFSGYLGSETLALGSPLAMSGTITNMSVNDTIDLENTAATTVDVVGSLLTVKDGSVVVATLEVTDAFGLDFTLKTDNAGGTDIIASIACFTAGTDILTDAGERRVETLRPGDRLAATEGLAEVAWVGETIIDLARHPRPDEAAPIRLRAGALAPGVPRRDLLLSPDHALLVDGLLVQAQALVNGASIRREVSSRDIAYHHLELDRHDLMFAEGAACETYLDTGNRGVFDGEAGVRPLHADFSAGHDGGGACGPLLLTGPSLAARHRRLRERARRLGYVLSCAAELEIVGSGGVLRLTPCGRGRWRVALRGDGGMLRLCSRTWVPEQLDRGSDDRRTLGVAVTGIRLDGVDVALDDARLGPGWHAPEQAAARRWRWTDGAAVLDVGSARELEISLRGGGAAYWLSTGRRMARAA